MRDAFSRRTTRDAILDATELLLTRYGYKKMTIDDLAKEVGIGKGTVYLHFPSKEEIALSHVDRIIERLKERLWETASSDLTPELKLKKMLIERVMFRFDAVQHYTMSLNEMMAQIRPRLLERRQRYFEEESVAFAEVIQKGKRSGVLTGDPDETAQLLLVATNSLLPYSLSTYELGSRDEILDKTARLADLLLKGIVKR